MTKIFIDGSAGTTGLRIADRLANRSDIQLVKLPDELRKNNDARKDAIHSSDIVFLCLPDAAAIEAVGLAGDSKVKIIDTSTAHRTNEGGHMVFPSFQASWRQSLNHPKELRYPVVMQVALSPL